MRSPNCSSTVSPMSKKPAVHRRYQCFKEQRGIGVGSQLAAGDAALDDGTQRVESGLPRMPGERPG